MILKATTNMTSDMMLNAPKRDRATVKNRVDSPIISTRVVTMDTLKPILIKVTFNNHKNQEYLRIVLTTSKSYEFLEIW